MNLQFRKICLPLLVLLLTALAPVVLNAQCIPPGFSACPTNSSTPATVGACSATVAYTVVDTGTAPVALSYAVSGATTASGTGTGSGSTFNVGTNNVVITATNGCGSATCSFTVTVTDNQAPTATCQNVTLVLDGSGNASLSTTAVNNGSSDNCSISSYSLSASSFTCANVGAPVPPAIWINEFHYDNTGTDVGEFVEIAGTAGLNLANYAIIRYNGSVPGAATIYTTPAQTTVMTGTIPNQSNGYGTFAVLYPQDGLQNGTADGFALVNTLTSTVVQLLSYEGQFTVASGQGLASGMTSTNLPVSEPGTLTGGSVRLAGTGNAYSSFTWQAQAAPSTPGAINPGQTFVAGGGANVILTVTDASSNTATCAADIAILDNQAPAITCPSNMTMSAVTGTCGATVTYTAPNGTDNCTPTTTQTAGLGSGVTYPVGVTTNTFSVTDGGSNTTTCSFTVTVNDAEAPQITCPSNISVNNDLGSCGASITYTAPVGTDNCSGATTAQSAGLASGTTFPEGVTTNTFTATDASGNTATCTFTVAVTDSELPTWSGCPGNLSLSTSTNTCDTVATWTAPTASDNCSIATLNSTSSPGATFIIGTTTVTYTAEDATGNSATCAFTVTVIDSVAPNAICQTTTLLLDSLGSAVLDANDVNNGSTDNCAIDTIVVSQTSFNCSNAGFNPVVLTVSDHQGNTSTCAATVIVNSTNVSGTLTADTTTCGYNVSCTGAADGIAHVQGTGGCPGYTYQWSNGSILNTAIGLGAGSHTVTITDGAGTTSVQTITLTEPSAIQIGSSATSSCFGDSTGSLTVTASGGNDCQGYSYLWSNGATSSTLTGLAAGTYSVTVTDASGCTNSASLAVTALSALNPTITVNGDDLSSVQTWVSYQWLLNGNPIPGATSSTYTATVSGNYSLQVTDINGCTGISASSTVVGIDAAFGTSVTLFPNPVTTGGAREFRLHFGSPVDGAVMVSIYDLLGRRVQSRLVEDWSQDVTFSVEGYVKGTYLVELRTADGRMISLRLLVE